MKIKTKRELFRFESEQHWINNAQSWYGNSGVRNSDYISIDSRGVVCRTGKQFMDATKDNAYPVIVYELDG